MCVDCLILLSMDLMSLKIRTLSKINSFRLEKGLKIANQLVNNNSTKFGSLVNHICQKLQSSYEKKIFTKEEEEKLILSLDLNQENLNILLDTISYIYKQAAYNAIEPSTMEIDLKTLDKVDNDTLLLVVKAWTTYKKGIIENFKHLSIYPVQVIIANNNQQETIVLFIVTYHI